MKISDKILSLIVLGTICPVVLMLAAWWGSIPFVGDNGKLTFMLALSAFAAGILIDIFVLRKFIFRLFRLPIAALAAIEVFYSVVVYGFMMGLPVLNAFSGVVAGYIVSRGGVLSGMSRESAQKNARTMDLISASILFLLCVATAAMALNEKTMASQLKSMLGLPFDVTMTMIWLLIFIGGALLLVFQYAFSRLAARCVLKRNTAGA